MPRFNLFKTFKNIYYAPLEHSRTGDTMKSVVALGLPPSSYIGPRELDDLRLHRILQAIIMSNHHIKRGWVNMVVEFHMS